jgi:hypothetical protein
MTEQIVKTRVTTRDATTDAHESESVIDHAIHDHRVWLANHLHWALRNDKCLILEPTTDEFTRKR